MSNDDAPFHNPFAALASMPGVPAPAPAEKPAPVAAPPGQIPAGVKPIARAVVRMERSGRGGKEVTVIEHLGLQASALDTWVKALKGAMGCGGYVEGDNIVLQGDQRKRLPPILTARGVKKITIG